MADTIAVLGIALSSTVGLRLGTKDVGWTGFSLCSRNRPEQYGGIATGGLVYTLASPVSISESP